MQADVDSCPDGVGNDAVCVVIRDAANISPTWWDWLQLVVLVMTAAAAVFAVIATFRVHRLSAGRVTVQMILATFAPQRGMLTTTRSGKFHREDGYGPQAELAQVVVENPGRHGVTVTSVSLRISGAGMEDFVATPRSFQLTNMGRDTANGKTYARVEPYHRVTFLLDFWSMVDKIFAENSVDEITVSAEVEAAGHRKPIRSKTEWKLYRHARSALPDRRRRRIDDIVLIELVRDLAWDDERRARSLDHAWELGDAVPEIVARIRPDSSREDVITAGYHGMEQVRDDAQSPRLPSMVAFRIHDQIRKLGRHVDWGPQEKAKRWVFGGSTAEQQQTGDP